MLFSLFEKVHSGEISGSEMFYYLLVMFFALTLAFSVHEFMHAYSAHLLGDDTAKNMGRLTLNPMSHLDPLGTVLILVMGFGWGKPVMVNPNRLNRFKSKKAMNIMVDLAGVTGNFILALLSMILVTVIEETVGTGNNAAYTVCEVFYFTAVFSLMLMAFNVIPLPPLDGFNVMNELLPREVKRSDGYRQFIGMAPQILLIIIIVGSFTGISVFGFIIQKIEWPFAWVINKVCDLIAAVL